MGNTTLRPPGPSEWPFLAVLGATAGSADAVSFLSLGGLFVSHITGDVVILIAHHAAGVFSRLGPMLAPLVFVSAVSIAARIGRAASRGGYRPRRVLLWVQVALLATSLTLAAGVDPLTDPDDPMAVLVGMFAVAGLAMQSTAGRITPPNTPATAVLTMNAVQLTLDLVALGQRRDDLDDPVSRRHRARQILACVAGFVAGCAAGAILGARIGSTALALPVGLSVLAVLLEAGGTRPVGRPV